MRSYCSEWPEFHPEFGLFCPSVRQRRAARLATIFFMSLMVIGASRGLAASHRPDRDETILATLAAEDAVERAQMPELTTPASGEAAAAPVRPEDPCKGFGLDDFSASFLNPACKIQGRHGQHKVTRVATFGHIELASTSSLPAPLSALTMMMQEVATKVAAAEKRGSAAAERRTASVKKHKSREAPIEVAHASNRPGGMPYMVNAYTTESKLNRAHGPFNESLPRKHAGL